MPCNRVGYWWSEKKSRKFNAEVFADVCRLYGLELVKVDFEKPFEEQGPFGAIIHKFSDNIVKAEKGDEQAKVACRLFQEYVDHHPEIVVLDPLPNVEKLLDRFRQYTLAEQSELQKQGIVFIPAFVELRTLDVADNLAKMKAAGVDFPFVCKPSVAQSSTHAHQMSLIFNEEGLADLSPPCIAQKFVNHDAVLYKLFVVGDQYFITQRPSLKNFYAGDHKTIFFRTQDISKPHCASDLTKLDAPRSPVIWADRDKMDHIVRVLSRELGLNLFGIDIIIDNRSGQYAIVDMNIFPGYNEVECIFQLLCDLIVRKTSLHSPISLPCGKTSKSQFCFEPYTPRCFCCPLSGTCIASLASDTEYIQSKSFCQDTDDSGIETSDSCDEKKKESNFRTVKRLHSRNAIKESL